MKSQKLWKSERGIRSRASLNDKNGSYTVFITIIFASIILFLSACIRASGAVAIDSAFKAFGRTWGRSILAEYDIELKERYGIFGFYADQTMVENKLDSYVKYTTDDKKYLKYGGSSCSLDGYALINPNNFVEQVRDVAIYRTKPKINYKDDGDRTNHYINSKWVINALPSNSSNMRLDSSLVDSVSLYDYLFVYFKDYVNDRDLGRTYFRNEIEYVITGKLNDEQARQNTYYQILALRNADNLAYLYSCPEKRALVAAISEILGPEMAPALEVALMEGWAIAEAKNDLALLYAGKKVPIAKSDATWATSFWNAIIGYSGGLIDTGVEDGLDYDGYLKTLLLKTSDQKKVQRIMDLIQINLKYNYCDYFLIDDYYVGLDFELKLNGKSYEFTETYKRQEG